MYELCLVVVLSCPVFVTVQGATARGGALGPIMYGCVHLRCCDFYPVWQHFSQFKYSVWEQITIVVLSESKDLEIVNPFGSIFAEKDTRLGSKNGENDTLPSGTYPVPEILKCPPPRGSTVV